MNMNESEKHQAQQEALRATAKDSADRSKFWAGLNKFLAAAARKEQEATRREQDAEKD